MVFNQRINFMNYKNIFKEKRESKPKTGHFSQDKYDFRSRYRYFSK
jgi:hypothetical protein